MEPDFGQFENIDTFVIIFASFETCLTERRDRVVSIAACYSVGSLIKARPRPEACCAD
jgi:hypothetical protein